MKENLEHVPMFELSLANGKSLATTNAEELYWFNETGGASITQPRKGKGGKAKGARNRGKSKVKRTRDER